MADPSFHSVHGGAGNQEGLEMCRSSTLCKGYKIKYLDGQLGQVVYVPTECGACMYECVCVCVSDCALSVN